MRIFRKIVITVLIFIGLSAFFVFWANYTIEKGSKNFVSFDVSSLPAVSTAVVLGTNRNLGNGNNPNLYFSYRIKAAARLYKSGKIRNIIVSGDNSRKGYNEPEQMKNDLIAEGIPAEKINRPQT